MLYGLIALVLLFTRSWAWTPAPMVSVPPQPRASRQPAPRADLPQVADEDEDDMEGDEPLFYLQGLLEWDSPADLAGRIALTAGFLAPAIIVASWVHKSDVEQQMQREMIMQVLREDVDARLEGRARTDALRAALPEAPAQLDAIARKLAGEAAPASSQVFPPPASEEDGNLDADEARALLAEYRKPWRESLAAFGIGDILPRGAARAPAR